MSEAETSKCRADIACCTCAAQKRSPVELIIVKVSTLPHHRRIALRERFQMRHVIFCQTVTWIRNHFVGHSVTGRRNTLQLSYVHKYTYSSKNNRSFTKPNKNKQVAKGRIEPPPHRHGDGDSSIFLRSPRVSTPSRTSIRSVVCAHPDRVTD